MAGFLCRQAFAIAPSFGIPPRLATAFRKIVRKSFPASLPAIAHGWLNPGGSVASRVFGVLEAGWGWPGRCTPSTWCSTSGFRRVRPLNRPPKTCRSFWSCRSTGRPLAREAGFRRRLVRPVGSRPNIEAEAEHHVSFFNSPGVGREWMQPSKSLAVEPRQERGPMQTGIPSPQKREEYTYWLHQGSSRCKWGGMSC